MSPSDSRSRTDRKRPDDNVLIQSVVGTLLVTPLAVTRTPSLEVQAAGLVLLMGGPSFAAHWLFLTAFGRLDVGVLAPLAYLEIAVAAVLGWALFGEFPTFAAWFGVLLVGGAGLMIATYSRSRDIRSPVISG